MRRGLPGDGKSLLTAIGLGEDQRRGQGIDAISQGHRYIGGAIEGADGLLRAGQGAERMRRRAVRLVVTGGRHIDIAVRMRPFCLGMGRQDCREGQYGSEGQVAIGWHFISHFCLERWSAPRIDQLNPSDIIHHMSSLQVVNKSLRDSDFLRLAFTWQVYARRG